MEAAHRQRRVAQYGDDGVVVLWRRLPVASSASLYIGLGFRTVGTVAAVNLVT